MKDHKMKRHTKLFIATAGTLAIVGGLGFAATKVVAGSMRGGHGMEMMERIDTNADGKITMPEITAHRDKLHAEFDKDGNNAISLSEFEGIWLSMMRPRMVDRFQMMDDDGDGQITNAEVDKKMSRMMRWMDRDDDGAISLKEMHRNHKYRKHHDDDDDGHDRRFKDKS